MARCRASFLVLAIMGALAGCDGGGGGTDAGTGADSGDVSDAGTDSGPGDAGVRYDPPASLDDCFAEGFDVWTPPLDVPAYTMADRGRVVQCAEGGTISASDLDMRARMRGYDGPALTSGAVVTHVLYRSEHESGEGAWASGTLYLPEAGATDAPLLVHASGTTGFGEQCAPSRGSFTDLERTLWVLLGMGQPTFVPDMIGLGTPGPFAWLEPYDAGHSMLDGARAALSIAGDALSGEVALSGHSAGGHAALSAQALQRDYAPDLDVLGVNAIASVWFDTAQFGLLVSQPNYPNSTPDPADSYWNVIYGAMYFVGHTSAYEGEDHAWDPIAAGVRDQVRTAFEANCLTNPDGTSIHSALRPIAGTVSAMFDANLQMSFVNYQFTSVADETVMRWVERFAADRPTLDPMGAPITFHQGTMDNRSTLELMTCPIRETMAADARTTACIYTDVNHNVIAGEAAAWTVEWTRALAAGTAPPACIDTTTPLPTCD